MIKDDPHLAELRKQTRILAGREAHKGTALIGAMVTVGAAWLGLAVWPWALGLGAAVMLLAWWANYKAMTRG